MSPPVAVGDHFTMRDGVVVVVTNRFHRRQTFAFWVTGSRVTEVINLAHSYGWGGKDSFGVDCLGWDVKSNYPEGFPKSEPEALVLCALSELDEEENEFGTISP